MDIRYLKIGDDVMENDKTVAWDAEVVGKDYSAISRGLSRIRDGGDIFICDDDEEITVLTIRRAK